LEQQFGRDGKIVPFFRYAYAHRGLNDVRQNIGFGVGLEEPLGQNADPIGLGFSWGQPPDRTLRDHFRGVLSHLPYPTHAPDARHQGYHRSVKRPSQRLRGRNSVTPADGVLKKRTMY
jgi:hypothetical protein